MERTLNEIGENEDGVTSLSSSGAPTNTIPPAGSSYANSDDPLADKRRAIRAIMMDSLLTDLEKRMRIHQVMDGRSRANHENSQVGGTEPLENDEEPIVIGDCSHYQRNCSIVAPCCNRVFGCHVCHDESKATSSTSANNQIHDNDFSNATPPCQFDRFSIQHIVCNLCLTRQDSKRNECVCCNSEFGEYHCPHCNLWMTQEKKPFHCSDCGFCRVGGQENFYHCQQCCMCIATVCRQHNCRSDKFKNDCPVCREDLFSSRQPSVELPCGHAIHTHCLVELSSFDYRCPICKKSVVSQEIMKEAWTSRALDISMQSMPNCLHRMVNILCNDCEARTANQTWHILGVQCAKCESFNTVINEIVRDGEQSASPLREAAPDLIADLDTAVREGSTTSIPEIDAEQAVQTVAIVRSQQDDIDTDRDGELGQR